MKKTLTTLALVALLAGALLAASSVPIRSLSAGGAVVATDLIEVSRSELGGDRWRPYSLELGDILPTTQMFSFTESAATTYTATVEIPAGAIVQDICFTSTVLWGGTSASLIVGDDDDDNGWFAATNLKATDLLVGEVLCAADDGTWGGKNGAYLTAAGRRGRVTAGVDSGWYYGAASEVIFAITAGTPSTTGRSFGWVTYTVPVATASTDT